MKPTQSRLLVVLSSVGGFRDIVCTTSLDVGVRESTLNNDVSINVVSKEAYNLQN